MERQNGINIILLITLLSICGCKQSNEDCILENMQGVDCNWLLTTKYNLALLNTKVKLTERQFNLIK